MIRLALALAVLLPLSVAKAQFRMVKRLDSFHSIDHRTGYDLVLTDRGTNGSVIIEGKEDAVGLITTTVRDGTIYIASEPNKNFLPDLPFFNARLEIRQTIRITVSCRGLASLRTEGAGTVTANNFRFRDLKTESLGGGALLFKRCRFYSLESNLEGKGRVLFENCEAVDTRLELEGDGAIEGHTLRTKNLDARVFGAGRITAYPRELLKARVTGKGSILYRGNPSSLEKEIAEGGTIGKYLGVISEDSK